MKVLSIKESMRKLEDKIMADFEENNQLNIEEIIEVYHAYIDKILKNSMTNQEDREEILSDVFMILWKNQNRIDKTMKIKPYLVGITKNLVRKKYRIQIKSHENIEDYEEKIGDFVNVENLIEENEKSKIVQQVIEKMKPQDQQIFQMFYYQAKKIKEISQELKISEIKVKVTLHRLRKLAKKKLKERGYDYGKS